MKLKSAAVSGFRGAPVPVELRLAQKSLCLLAENGHGKTTIVDGLEFWSSGDIRHYHREGYELDCVVNVDSQSATVTFETSSHPPLTRTLVGGTASQLQPTGPIAVGAALPPPSPWLPEWLPHLEAKGITVDAETLDVSLVRDGETTVIESVTTSGLELVEEGGTDASVGPTSAGGAARCLRSC